MYKKELINLCRHEISAEMDLHRAIITSIARFTLDGEDNQDDLNRLLPELDIAAARASLARQILELLEELLEE